MSLKYYTKYVLLCEMGWRTASDVCWLKCSFLEWWCCCWQRNIVCWWNEKKREEEQKEERFELIKRITLHC